MLFHWDRRGPGSDTSCWIRCVQPWAGVAFGHQFIPRTGMEVAVTFEGGDPDKPVVIGSLYNGTHPPPFPLPANKTQSGIRTRSTPGGGGFNELMSEDAAARERIYVHAQRDLDEVVGRDHTLLVHADETVNVNANRRDTVGKDAAYQVRGDTSVHHLGSRVDVVEKDLDQRVSGMRATRIEGRDELDARTTSEHRYAADFTTRVTGNQTIIVGKHEAPRSLTIRVEGTGTFSTEDALELASNKGITFRCGDTSIRIGADGIELQGAMVRTTGEKGGLEAGKDGVKLSSDKVYAHLGDKLLVKTDGSSLAMGSEFKVDGAKILLNSPEKATEAPPPEKKPPTEIELKDTDGAPLPGQRFVIELEDGSPSIASRASPSRCTARAARSPSPVPSPPTGASSATYRSRSDWSISGSRTRACARRRAHPGDRRRPARRARGSCVPPHSWAGFSSGTPACFPMSAW